MGKSAVSLYATPEAFGRASFAAMDVLRRTMGSALGAFGLDPDECPHRIVDFGPHWLLRDYGGHHTNLSLLLITTPIKTADVWGFFPSLKAGRDLLRDGV